MTKRKIVWFLALALLALAGPGLAAAQTAVLYEVTESMKLKSMQEGNFRTATASLMGSVAAGNNSICPATLAAYFGKAECAIIVTAHDSVNLATGRGPVRGSFKIVIHGDNLVDGPELVVFEGTLTGTVDLSVAILGPDDRPLSGDEGPLGAVTGHWRAHGTRGGPLEGARARGTFTGTFRLPFVLPAFLDPTQTPVYLYDPATQQVGPVQANEYSLGVPTVRLEITFVEKH